jgi:hypothetical protein
MCKPAVREKEWDLSFEGVAEELVDENLIVEDGVLSNRKDVLY